MVTKIHPVKAECWSDLEKLFGEHGADAGCWCMFWRLKRSEFKELRGEGTKAMLRGMTQRNEIPGLLAYVNGQTAGWCSVGPRQSYLALENSRILKRLDDQPVWSVVCFFIAKAYRRQGLMVALVRGALDYARKNGAGMVEAYPIDMQSPRLAGQKLTGCSGYMGVTAAFREAGFVEVSRASETQVIMRCALA